MSGKASGDTKDAREHHDGSSTRAFTVEQKAAVIRVKKCGATAFYDILGLESVRGTCSDLDIKKAYRKLSLLTHPDKNGYEGADEAFKMVSRAFQILSDEDKRKKYDKFGGDPESRFGGGGASAAASGASPFSGFASQRGPGMRAGGPMFEEEISPEELFRQFFGGGMGMGGPFGGGLGGFGGGGPFVFNLGGGPGIRVHQFGGNRPRRRPHNHENATPTSPLAAIQSLLPLLLLFLVPLLSSLFSSSGPTGPSIRMDAAKPPQTQLRTSHKLKVPYWVNPVEVKDYTAKNWRDLDKSAEGQFIYSLRQECAWEGSKQQQLADEAQGFFFTDQVKMDRARKMPKPSCDRLKEYGYRPSGY
ncbi:Hypothetical protein R9X50_00505300 [Acrodontium crateriforme]|uniref:J domain-containing protein n=1 Tax=Acrodontium crateriforme TaxID=150365 RepID=A0AAQ3M8N9_9PEZI|nr:Hypothetical protein R9X50_00505300 [Acrodontium crateriforme]